MVYCRYGTETNETEEGRNADIDGTVPRFHGSNLSSWLLVWIPPAGHHRGPFSHSLTENDTPCHRSPHSTWQCSVSPCTGTGASRPCREMTVIRECAVRIVSTALFKSIHHNRKGTDDVLALNSWLWGISGKAHRHVWPSELLSWMECIQPCRGGRPAPRQCALECLGDSHWPCYSFPVWVWTRSSVFGFKQIEWSLTGTKYKTLFWVEPQNQTFKNHAL